MANNRTTPRARFGRSCIDHVLSAPHHRFIKLRFEPTYYHEDLEILEHSLPYKQVPNVRACNVFAVVLSAERNTCSKLQAINLFCSPMVNPCIEINRHGENDSYVGCSDDSCGKHLQRAVVYGSNYPEHLRL